MNHNIDCSIFKVNRPVYLTANNRDYRFATMKYGERLKLAREYAGLNQEELAERAGIKQPSLSYLENPRNSPTGSEHTARFARICRVSVDWLSDEIGEMTPIIYQTSDPKIIAAALVMEPLSEYGKDSAVKSVTEIAQLIAHVKEGGNGTDG